MSEYTYLEQYVNQVILPHYLHDRLMEALKEVKDQKNEKKIKKAHEFIDYYENNVEKLKLYQKVLFEFMYAYNIK